MADDDVLKLPARPAAVTALNVAGLVVAAIASGGGAGVAAAAALLAGGGAVVEGRRRTTAHRAARRAATGKGGAGGVRSRAAGAPGPVPRSRTQAGSPSTGSRSRARSPLKAGKDTAGTGTPSRRSPLSSLLPGTRGTRGTRTGTRAATGRPSSPALRAARSAGKLAMRPLTRAHRDVTGGSATTDRLTRGARGVVARAGRRAGRAAWKGARRFVQRNIMGRGPAKKVDPKKAPPKREVGRAVTAPAAVSAESIPKSAHSLIPAPLPVAHSGPVVHSISLTRDQMHFGGMMYDAARKIEEYAAAFDQGEPGMLEILDKLKHDVMPAITVINSAMDSIIAVTRRRLPVDVSVKKKFDLVGEMLTAADQVARRIPEDIEVIHQRELDALRNPEVGADRWDQERNRVRRG